MANSLEQLSLNSQVVVHNSETDLSDKTPLKMTQGATLQQVSDLLLADLDTGVGPIDGQLESYAIGTNALANLDTSAERSNIAIGTDALFSANTQEANIAVGARALYYMDSNAGDCVAIGKEALYQNRNSQNVAVGVYSGRNSFAGQRNVGVGYGALAGNPAGAAAFGNDNTAIGAQALYALQSGGNTNTAVGVRALESVTTALGNVAFGVNAGKGLTTGSANTLVGRYAGEFLTSGSDNVIIGTAAGRFISGTSTPVTGAANSISIGRDTKFANPTPNNQIVIGWNANGVADNTIMLGNGSITNLYCYGALSSPSDISLKENVEELPYGLAEVVNMRPVEYDLKADGRHDIGFIAQEMQQVVPDVVTEMGDGILSIQYAKLVPVLVNAIKELQAEVELLKSK